jgi:hypothetical protein
MHTVAVCLEPDSLPIEGFGRDRVEGTSDDIGESRQLPRIEIHAVDVEDAVLTVGGEVEAFSVWRECRALVLSRPEGELLPF